MALKLDDIVSVLKEQKLDATTLQTVVKKLEQVEEENKAERGSGPKQKNQFVVVLKGSAEMEGKEYAAWVTQIPDGEDHNTVLSRLKVAATNTDNAQKRKKKSFKTVSEAFRNTKPVFAKEQKLRIKTKDYVPVIVVVDEALSKIV